MYGWNRRISHLDAAILPYWIYGFCFYRTAFRITWTRQWIPLSISSAYSHDWDTSLIQGCDTLLLYLTCPPLWLRYLSISLKWYPSCHTWDAPWTCTHDRDTHLGLMMWPTYPILTLPICYGYTLKITIGTDWTCIARSRDRDLPMYHTHCKHWYWQYSLPSWR